MHYAFFTRAEHETPLMETLAAVVGGVDKFKFMAVSLPSPGKKRLPILLTESTITITEGRRFRVQVVSSMGFYLTHNEY